MHLTGNDVAACVIVGIITLLMLLMSIPLLRGRGAWLIAGFNTMDKREREKYDAEALCQFMGRYLLSVALLTPAIAIGGILKLSWLSIGYTLYVVISVIFVVIYCNTGNRFKK